MKQTAVIGLSTHVLNTSNGLPADDMLVKFQALEGEKWCDRFEARTNSNGRINSMSNGAIVEGTFRLVFATGEWFERRCTECFFPEVAIEFRITDPMRHHHVPLLLSPFGYSTYRGS